VPCKGEMLKYIVLGLWLARETYKGIKELELGTHGNGKKQPYQPPACSRQGKIAHHPLLTWTPNTFGEG